MMTRIRPTPHCHQGFSLVEVMVAVLVISIGLLGIAKMQALALSNTTTARLRSLAALEAASLASAMQADRNYWALVPTVTTPVTVAITGTTVFTPSDAALNSTTVCAGGTTCTVAQMAAYDLQNWITAVDGVIKGAQTTINCAMPAPTVTPSTPVTCKITLSWSENLIASSAAEANTAATALALQTPKYELIVQP